MRYCIIVLVCICCVQNSFGQEEKDFFSLTQKKQEAFISGIKERCSTLDKKIVAQTQKTLHRLQKQEQKLYKKLYKKDSVAAKQLFVNSEQRYAELEAKLLAANESSTQKKLKEYLPTYDTLSTSLSFLQQKLPANSSLLTSLQGSKKVVEQFGNRVQVANEIKKQLKERKAQIAKALQGTGLAKHMKALNKEVYYYQEQLNEYKSLLTDRKKLEQKALSFLRNTEAFKSFMKKNSMLAQLFKLPDDYYSPASLAGLQTTASVQAVLSQRFAGAGVSPQQYMQGQVNQAQNEINKLKSKLNKIGAKSSSDIDADGFKPNTQKTKSFLKRLEYGTNFQTQRVNSYFPVTTDVALSVGYKLNDRSVIGIGASYKLGLGSGIEHIKFTHEGVGLRSFVDWKLKGGLWITGGYEQNYLQRFSDFRAISDVNLWRQSALLGITKKVKVKGKTSKVQLMYDFFYQKDNIHTQPLIFRVGYGI